MLPPAAGGAGRYLRRRAVVILPDAPADTPPPTFFICQHKQGRQFGQKQAGVLGLSCWTHPYASKCHRYNSHLAFAVSGIMGACHRSED